MIRAKKAPNGLHALIAVVGLAACAPYSPAPVSLAQMRMLAVRAADVPANVTSAQLLSLALSHDPAVAAARANLAAAESDRRASKQLPAMSASLSAEYSKQADASRPWMYGGALGIPLDTGARHDNRVTAADIAVLKARYVLADAIWAVRQRLRQAQCDVSLAQGRILLSQQLLDQRKAAEAHAARLVRSGEEAQSILVQARLDTSAAVQARLQAQAQYDLALTALARALNTDVAGIASIPPVPHLPEASPEAGRIQTLGDQALYARGDIAAALSDYDSAEADLRLAVAQQYPDITISPGYTWERGVVKIPLGLSLSLPPLDGNRAHIAAAQNRRLAAGKSLEDRVRTAQTDIGQAMQTWQADLIALDKIQADDLPMAQDLAQQSLRRVQTGDLDQGALLGAQIAETQVELARLQARQTVLNDRLKLEDVLHQSLSGDDEPVLKNALSEVVK